MSYNKSQILKQDLFYKSNRNVLGGQWLIPGIIITVLVGWFIAENGISILALFLVLPFIAAFVVLVFLKPKVGYYMFIIYSFLVAGLTREMANIPFGLGQDGILLLTWLAVIFHKGNRLRLRHLNNDFVWIGVIWFLITVAEIGNPERPSIEGWYYEMRSTTLYWVLSVPLVILLFNKKEDINTFFDFIIIISFIAALYGAKQLFIGPSDAEREWLEAGAKRTHILFGKLRVFAFYTDAGQFGASQGHVGIMCIILATGPFRTLKKMWYVIAGLVILYGMLISGTRGALFAIVGGGFTFLVLSKQVKVLIIGSILGLGFLGMLKYTSIGSGNAQIQRLRSSVNPDNPSLQVRLVNQKRLKEFLKTKPLGYGVGTIGIWGIKYNKRIPINSIPPDSYFVKVWAEYGIIGLVIWISFMMYILGKSAGIIWNTRDPILRIQLSALCAGCAAILLCSYGNEVINQMPSSMIVYTSWGLVWLGARWDTPDSKSDSEITKVSETVF